MIIKQIFRSQSGTLIHRIVQIIEIIFQIHIREASRNSKTQFDKNDHNAKKWALRTRTKIIMQFAVILLQRTLGRIVMIAHIVEVRRAMTRIMIMR